MIPIQNTLPKKPELLAPGGDIEKLKTAVEYGADAVYVGGEGFNLRMGAPDITLEEINEATTWIHNRGKKIYITLHSHSPEYTSQYNQREVCRVLVPTGYSTDNTCQGINPGRNSRNY